jgi:chaperone modulatory protein CbpM
MNSNDLPLVHIGTIIEEDELTLGQLCRVCSVHADWVISLVEEGRLSKLSYYR